MATVASWRGPLQLIVDLGFSDAELTDAWLSVDERSEARVMEFHDPGQEVRHDVAIELFHNGSVNILPSAAEARPNARHAAPATIRPPMSNFG